MYLFISEPQNITNVVPSRSGRQDFLGLGDRIFDIASPKVFGRVIKNLIYARMRAMS